MSEELKPGGLVPSLKPATVAEPDPEDEYIIPMTPSGPAEYAIRVSDISLESIRQVGFNAGARPETPPANRHQLTDLRRTMRQTRALVMITLIMVVFMGFLALIIR